MSNSFLEATVRVILRHGKQVTYKSIAGGTYDVNTGSVTNSETSYTPKAYKKHISATQYYFPSMIGKELSEFYIAGSALPVRPKVNDQIIYEGTKFNVHHFTEHIALGEVCLYCLVCVKA